MWGEIIVKKPQKNRTTQKHYENGGLALVFRVVVNNRRTTDEQRANNGRTHQRNIKNKKNIKNLYKYRRVRTREKILFNLKI